MVVSIETVRQDFQRLGTCLGELDLALMRAGDLEGELLSELTLLASKLRKRLDKASAEVRLKGAPLFAGDGQAGGKPRQRPKGE